MERSSAGPLQTTMIRAISIYQRVRSGRPSPCRYTPSCSEYAREAIIIHGPLRGVWFAVRRITRCNPFGSSGFDPVPGSHSTSLDR
ncbi:MAG: membrane protein insertion efficiency factor YidD [Ferrimicrobium sp.]